MDELFVRNRITELRTKKGVSEYRMSMDLGHCKTYIQGISSGRSMPSFTEFLYICEYLGVTPKEFFDTETNEPQMMTRRSMRSRAVKSTAGSISATSVRVASSASIETTVPSRSPEGYILPEPLV